jgi:hypothetical protein
MNDTMNLLVINSLAVWLIQKMKASSLVPWVTTETDKINQNVSVVISALAAAGMVFTVAHTGTVETGAVTLSWAGLTLSHFLSFAYHWIGYFASQKTIYKIWTGSTPDKALDPAPKI